MQGLVFRRCQAFLAASLFCAPWFIASGQPNGLDFPPQGAPYLNGAMPLRAPAVSGNWSAVVAFPHLLFTNALGLTAVPGTDDLCVWEREGRVWTFQNSRGARRKTLMLDIHNQCQGWDDSGLLGLAFHPGFATNHYLFVYYTWVKPGTVAGNATTRPDPVRPDTYHDRLSRWTIGPDGKAAAGSEKVLVDLTDQTIWHHGGGMFFNPRNGFLYWTDGDNSVITNDQTISRSLYSGVFRIDVDCRGGNISHPIPRQPLNGRARGYFIPNNNPFVGQSNALEEFFCLGLRSPHRMTLDPATGRIYIGDVGESSREEIDVIEPGEKGLNFQWPYCEGTLGRMPARYIGISRGPVLDYSHSDGRAVIGGYVYRGRKFTRDLGGKYIFGDNVMRTIWALDNAATPPRKELLCVVPEGKGPNSGTDYCGLSSFGTDARGEIYMCQMSSIGGRIFTLRRGGPPPPRHPLPKLLSRTGVFTDMRAMTPSAMLVPYNVNVPLWSDGAVKERWIALPRNSRIHFSTQGAWKFPAGTVFVKTFQMPVDERRPAVLRRLETRLLVRDADGAVYGATYKWRPDHSDADLVTTGTNEDIAIRTAKGLKIQRWFYPGRQDCLTCHTAASGGVLGVNTRQLNAPFTYPNGVTGNQLRAWNHIGMFDRRLDERRIAELPALTAVTNAMAPLEARVRSYLDANCAQCHRPGGVETFFDARYDTPLARQALIGGPVANSMGIDGEEVVAPQDLGHSALYQRVNMTGHGQMPPLARNVIDRLAVAVIGQWIQSLPLVASSLPPRWSQADIGETGQPGRASFLNGRFYVAGSGADIWESADAFHFVFVPLEGNGEIVAHLLSMQFTDPWAKAGVMLRADVSPAATHADMVITAGSGSVFQWRPGQAQSMETTAGPAIKAPYWIKLTRNGDTCAGYVSADGRRWRQVGSAVTPMDKTVYAGLAVTAHDNAALNSTLFDRVTVIGQSW